METNMGDQLNRAFEVYRQASIEKDSAKRELQQKRENMDSVKLHKLTGASNVGTDNVIDVFRELQENFRLIQALTEKQTDRLRKVYAGNDKANAEEQFSIPIQCTEVTAERAEGPLGRFSLASRSGIDRGTGGRVDRGQAPEPLPSRGSSSEEGSLADSLAKLDVRFPPPTDSEYDFLNSAVEKPIDVMARKKELPTVTGVPMVTEEQSLELSIPVPQPHAVSTPSSIINQGIRGPQQPLWSPDLCEATAQAAFADSQRDPNPRMCAFCKDLVPTDHILSHLNSHFQTQNGNGH
ncbi:hypothetical protein JZ751_027669 [Albula glossodonta]|uniref:Tbk1/Ikki binding domain-containing protein n=1 Tax=Albula glossodonta TaxID=121402 RepID=A0A8T2PBW9_9TELE|nr:hypothetical protein JZ751_027669 [Albula glossodonta]